MLIVEQHPDSDIHVTIKFNYYADYVRRVKKIPGAKYNGDTKSWVIDKDFLDLFEEEFKGEIVYKTPRWVLLNEKPPDYSSLYAFNKKRTVPTLKKPLYDYQEFGVRFILDRLAKFGFAICSDDVGIGKTPQGIATLQYLFDHNLIRNALVLGKKSLKKQWCDEIDDFSTIGQFREVVRTEGTVANRKKLYKHLDGKSCVLVTNYHTALNDTAELIDLNFDVVIIDEAHTVSSKDGKINHAIGNICDRAKLVLFLTGTPILDKPDDLYGIMNIADKKFFGPWDKFRKFHIRQENKGRYTKVIGYMNLDILREKVQKIIIRRTENEVSLSLPKMKPPKRINVEKDDAQIDIETELLKNQQEITEKLIHAKKPEAIKALETARKGMIASFQAVANDPRLFLMSKSKAITARYGPLVPTSYKMSPKHEALIELVEDITSSGHKVIIFTGFERAARLIKKDIESAFKFHCGLYTGKEDEEEREKSLTNFKYDDDCKVLIGTDAMAEGLNLQNANHVINYDQPHNPAIKIQRGGRVRRAGSKHKFCFMYDLITEDSADTDKLNKLEKADNLIASVVNLDEAQSEALKKAMAKSKEE